MDCENDSTGFKIAIRGDYLDTKWNRKRRGCSKLNAVISINDVSAIAFTITDDHVHDSRVGKRSCKISWAGLREYSATRVMIQRLFTIYLVRMQ